MMVMAFQSSPIFSLPRARLECSEVIFRFMRSLGICALLIIIDRPSEKRRASVKRCEGDPLEGGSEAAARRRILPEPVQLAAAAGTGRIQLDLVLALRAVDGVNRIGGVVLEARRDLVDLDRRKAGNILHTLFQFRAILVRGRA